MTEDDARQDGRFARRYGRGRRCTYRFSTPIRYWAAWYEGYDEEDARFRVKDSLINIVLFGDGHRD